MTLLQKPPQRRDSEAPRFIKNDFKRIRSENVLHADNKRPLDHCISSDLLICLLEYLPIVELCTLMPTSHWLRDKLRKALRRKRILNAREFFLEDPRRAGSSLDNKLAIERNSQRLHGVGKACPNLVYVEEDISLLTRGSSRGHLYSILLNQCPKLRLLGDIVFQSPDQFRNITAPELSLTRLAFVVEETIMTTPDIFLTFLQKLTKVKYVWICCIGIECLQAFLDCISRHECLPSVEGLFLIGGGGTFMTAPGHQPEVRTRLADSIYTAFPNLNAFTFRLDSTPVSFLEAFADRFGSQLKFLEMRTPGAKFHVMKENEFKVWEKFTNLRELYLKPWKLGVDQVFDTLVDLLCNAKLFPGLRKINISIELSAAESRYRSAAEIDQICRRESQRLMAARPSTHFEMSAARDASATLVAWYCGSVLARKFK